MHFHTCSTKFTCEHTGNLIFLNTVIFVAQRFRGMFLKQVLNYEKKIKFQYTDFVARKIVDLLYSAKQVDCLIAELMS